APARRRIQRAGRARPKRASAGGRVGAWLGNWRDTRLAALAGPALQDARLCIRCGACRAVSPLRAVLLPLARGGLWSACARGDGGRRGRGHLERLISTRGGRRGGWVCRPERRRKHQDGTRRTADLTGAAI